jgi:hypothetical protein
MDLPVMEGAGGGGGIPVNATKALKHLLTSPPERTPVGHPVHSVYKPRSMKKRSIRDLRRDDDGMVSSLKGAKFICVVITHIGRQFQLSCVQYVNFPRNQFFGVIPSNVSYIFTHAYRKSGCAHV